MQFLRTLIWMLLAGLVVAFAFNNWITVPVRLWGGLIADINLPLLIAISFLLGFLPLWVVHLATRWRFRQRLASAERTIAELRSALAGPAAEPAGTQPGDTLALPVADSNEPAPPSSPNPAAGTPA